jgi:hypothetical protein
MSVQRQGHLLSEVVGGYIGLAWDYRFLVYLGVND